MEDQEIRTGFMDRNEAEKKYGSRIYQGGVPIGEKIRIVRIGEDEDVQACAGTHLAKTGEVGPIKILHIERIQDGIERLEYAAGEAAIEAIQAQEELLQQSAAILRVPPEKLPSVVDRFFEEWKQLRKEIERLRGEIADLELERLKRQAREINGVKVTAAVLPDADAKAMMKLASQLSDEGFVTIIIGKGERRASVAASVPANLKGKIGANEVVKHVCEVLGGSGGGTPLIAQGGGENVELVEKARDDGLQFIEKVLLERKNRK
jgi:alanyl-tRNA synthetase